MLRLHSRQALLLGLLFSVVFPNILYPSLTAAAPLSSRPREQAVTPGFEPNVGQLPQSARFGTRGPGYEVLLTDSGAIFRVESRDAVRFQISGGNNHARAVAGERLPGILNLFPERNPSTWRTGVPTYRSVRYPGVYDGIDLLYYGREGRLEYDFDVRPGADPAAIGLRIDGARTIEIGPQGELEVRTPAGNLRFKAPVAYQTDNRGSRRIVAARYRIRGAREVGFEIGAYDRSRRLVIDPVLTYATFLGNTGDTFVMAGSDSSGNAYVAGRSAGAIVVQKMSTNGTTVLYRTVIGSGYSATVQAMAVDSAGNVYLTGASGVNLPATPNAFKATIASGTHAFAGVLNAAGTLTYLSYLAGTNGTDQGNGLAVDSTGKMYITGGTSSSTFPTTGGVFQTTFPPSGQAGFVAKFNPAASGAASLVYSTYLGGAASATTEFGIGVDSTGAAYVAGLGGADFPVTPGAFQYNGLNTGQGGLYVTKLNPTATAPLAYSAYVGFQNSQSASIAVDGSGNAYVTGTAGVSDFPTTAGAYQISFPGVFVTELNSTGTSLVYSTFLNGPSEANNPVSFPESIALQPGCVSACNAYIAGFTSAQDFPMVNPIQAFNASAPGGNDAFLVELSGNGTAAVLSTYLGGSQDESSQGLIHSPGIAVTPTGDTIIAGLTSSSADYPITILPSGTGRGAYVAKIGPTASAKAVATPATLTFTSQPIPVPSTALPVMLRNVGSAALSITSIAASGDYLQTNNCGASLAAGTNCTITVTFTPSAVGTRTGTITVTHGGTNSPTMVNLTGTGAHAAFLKLTPTSLNFNGQPVGTAGTSQQVSLSNIGDTALTLSGFTISVPDFVQTNNCPASVAPNASCTLNLSFLPTQQGLRTGTLNVSSNSNGLANSTVNLSGYGQAGTGALTLSSTGLNFAPQSVGVTSSFQTLTITNTGNVGSSIFSATAGGDYLATTSCTNLNPGASCTVRVNFTPTATGARPSTLTILDSTAASPRSVALTGNGVAATKTLSITPGSLVFPDTSTGLTSQSKQISITNAGTVSVLFNRVVESGDFRITSTSCSNLRPAFSCSVTVVFNPTAAGSRTGTITLTDTATGSPQTIALSGRGVTDVLAASVSPANMVFLDTAVGLASASQNVVLTNNGNVPINIANITFTGTNAGDFSQSASCFAITPTHVCSIPVTFTPSGIGNRTAVMNITDEVGTQTMNLSGTGVTAALTLGFIPVSMTFQAQATTTTSPNQNLIIRNSGNEQINITNIVAAGDYALASNPCVTTLQPNGACTLQVTFTPSGTGTRAGSITFTDNATGSPQTVNLTGQGIATAPVLKLSPSALAFALQVTATTSGAQNVTLTNTSASAVNTIAFAHTGDFSISTNNCGTSLAASASCSFGVTFTPAVAGARTGTISVTSSVPTQTINLAGFGAAPSKTALLRTKSLVFADQVISTTSGPQNISLTNTGNVPLTVSSVAVTPGDYVITNNCPVSPSTVAPNQTCTVGVTFTPTTSGNRTATVTITDDAPGSPRTTSLSGNGLTAVPGIVVDRPKLVFSSQVVNTASGQQTINVTNTGNSVVTINNVTLTGADFGMSNNCAPGSSLAAAMSCTIGVTFTPLATGAKTGTITITDSAPGSPQTVTLSGTGTASTKTVSTTPAGVIFDPQVVGTTSGFTQTVTVTNTGSFGVTFGAVTVTGNFSIQNACTGTLLPGTPSQPSSCTIQLSFTPTGTGSRTGTLNIADDATGTPQHVSISGTGIAPANSISLSQTTVVFDQQVVGTPSPQMAVYYYNQSSVTVNISNVTLSGGTDFTQTNNCNGAAISANGFCRFLITFNPSTAGIRTGSISITDSAPGSPRAISLAGTGSTVPAPAVTLAPSSLTFASQAAGTTSAPQNVNLTNSGESNLTISSITLTGANASDYSQTNNCSSTLTAGFSCTIAVTFHPTATGNRTGSLSVTDNAGGSPQTVAITGTGTAGSLPQVTFNPTSLAFSNVPVNTTSASQPSVLKNTGNAALNISGIAVTGGLPGDFAQTNNCPASLAMNATCTVNVTFNPSSVIDQTASVTVTSNAPSNPGLALTGNGTAPAVNLSATTLTFAARAVGTTSPAQTVTLENVGNLAMTISSISSFTTEFHIVSNTCPGSLGPGASCIFGVTFQPSATGTRMGFAMIADTAGDSPQFITLNGTGN
jgi:hypothetical protein